MHLIRDLLPENMKRQVRELFISTTLVNFALAMVMFFEPIYLYKIGYSLQRIMIFYLITYVLYLFLIPLGARFAKTKGYELGIFFGTVLFIAYYVGLFFIVSYPILFYIAPVIFAVQKTFYWPAYHADFARFSGKAEEGREVSAINAATFLVYIIGPALAGFIIKEWGYGALFTMASILFLSSNIFTLITKENFKPSGFSYRHCYKSLFSRANRQSFLAYTGFGEELVVLVIWPIFISVIINDVFNMGLVVTLATLVTTIITLYIGKLTDKSNKHSILSLGSVIYSLSWFLRIFVTNASGIFFVDTLSKVGKNVVAVPLTAITYEKAKDAGGDDNRQHIMSQVVFFEMSLAVGKLVALICIYLLLFVITEQLLAFKITFILAGAMTLLYMLL